MIERVAAHIRSAAINSDTSFVSMAKAAIEAMREPTDEMLKAFYGDMPCEQWLGNDWHDMINAALKE